MLRMRWLFGALLVMLALAVPAAAYDNPQINWVTVDSATIDRSGQVTIQGHIWCSENFGFQIDNGQVTQTVGRTKAVQGGFGGGGQCNGLTPWQSGARAYNGKFASGWATVNVHIQGAFVCDPNNNNNCWPTTQGGTQQYLKIANKG